MLSLRLTAVAVTVAWLVPGAVAAQDAPDLAGGRALFEGLCARCHGIEGTGGEGPNLDRPVDDVVLRAAIRDGLPDRGMPRVRRLTDRETEPLVAYVHSLGRAGAASVPGDPGTGRALYASLGCATCHTVDGQGGTFGPELTAIGARRGPEHLRAALLEPGTALPRGTRPVPAGGLTEFLPVLVIDRNGQEVRGLRVNEDTFTIQLRDASNRYYSFRKRELQHIEKQFETSLMPSYANRLTGSDADHLIAYLVGLRGRE